MPARDLPSANAFRGNKREDVPPLLEFAKPPGLRRLHTLVLLAVPVEGLLDHSDLSANDADGHAVVDLAHRAKHHLKRELFSSSQSSRQRGRQCRRPCDAPSSSATGTVAPMLTRAACDVGKRSGLRSISMNRSRAAGR